jgi:hypothetical protein
MIRFRCPKCDAKMEVDESFAGRPARCATCGYDLRVPKTGEPTPLGAATPARPGATTVKFQGEQVEIVPPMEPMAIISVALVALSVVVMLAAGVSGYVAPPWAVGAALGSLVALLGAIIAIPAYHTIRRSKGRRRGLGLATGGLAGGAGLFLIFGLIALVLFARQWYRPPCEDNLKTIYQALRAYTAKHDGAFPKSLETLVRDGLLDGDCLTCPAYRVALGTQTYILTPDVNVSNPLWPADTMVLSDGPPYDAHGDGFVRVVLLDGHVEKIPTADWPKYQQAQAARWNEILNKIRNPKPAGPAPAAGAGEPPAATPLAPAPAGKADPRLTPGAGRPPEGAGPAAPAPAGAK